MATKTTAEAGKDGASGSNEFAPAFNLMPFHGKFVLAGNDTFFQEVYTTLQPYDTEADPFTEVVKGFMALVQKITGSSEGDGCANAKFVRMGNIATILFDKPLVDELIDTIDSFEERVPPSVYAFYRSLTANQYRKVPNVRHRPRDDRNGDRDRDNGSRSRR